MTDRTRNVFRESKLFVISHDRRRERVALGRDRAFAFMQAAIPGGRSKAFHCSLLLLSCVCVGVVSPAVPRLRGSALLFRRDGRSARDGWPSPRWSWRSSAWP